MYPDQKSLCLVLIVLTVLTAIACGDDKKDDKTAAPEPEVTENNNTPPEEPGEEEVVASHKSRVRFVGGQRYVTDLSRALKLNRVTVCKELGEYDCVDRVHNITLGGVEPYHQSYYQPLEVLPVTAPIAIDRIAIKACDRRANLDFEDPNGAVLVGEVARAGKDATLEDYKASSRRVYEVLLRREAEEHEIEDLAAFAAEVEEEVGADRKAREWATMSCFVVATSMEALFY